MALCCDSPDGGGGGVAYRDWVQTRGHRPLADVKAIATLAERDDVNVLFVVIDTLRTDRLSAY